MSRPSSITSGLLGRRALVVDRVGPPLARQAAVVVGAEQRLGDRLAELAGVDARALLDVVGLEPVAGHLVEEDAAEAAADHDRHRAGRGRDRRRAGSAPCRAACSAIAAGSSSSSSKPRWAPSVSTPVSTASPRRATAWAPSRTRVRSSPLKQALGVGDRDLAARLGVGGGDLGDLAALRRGRARRARAAAPPCARPGRPRGGARSAAASVRDRLQRARLGAVAAQRGGRLGRRRARGRPGSSPSTWAK